MTLNTYNFDRVSCDCFKLIYANLNKEKKVREC